MFNFRESLNSSSKSAILVLKLIIPLFILADILLYFGILEYISFIFEPITNLLDLPPEAALGIAAGILFNLYAALAFLAPLGLTPYEWTILATFLGVAHSLVVENAIMKKLGIPHLYSWMLRLSVGILSTVPILLLPKDYFAQSLKSTESLQRENYESFNDMLINSLSNATLLALKVIVLVALIIFVMDYIKSTRFMKKRQKNANTFFSIVVGLVLGITYGAGILINEVKKGKLNKVDIFYIATFLMICHAIIEDTLLFVIFGADGLVVVSIRLAMAFIVSYILVIIYKKVIYENLTISE